MEYIGACTLYTEAFFRIRMGFFVLDMRAPNCKVAYRVRIPNPTLSITCNNQAQYSPIIKPINKEH